MISNEWSKWKNEKESKRDITNWTLRFKQAKNNKREWQIVYDAYLKSNVWKGKRNNALIRANGKCERCGSDLLNPDVHHVTYDNVGGNEKLEDLQVLCYSCHQKADHIRDITTDERRKNDKYQARLNGFALKKYGEGWWIYHDEIDVEIEFVSYLYKSYCFDNDIIFVSDFDPMTDLEFLEFWNDILDGIK